MRVLLNSSENVDFSRKRMRFRRGITADEFVTQEGIRGQHSDAEICEACGKVFFTFRSGVKEGIVNARAVACPH